MTERIITISEKFYHGSVLVLDSSAVRDPVHKAGESGSKPWSRIEFKFIQILKTLIPTWDLTSGTLIRRSSGAFAPEVRLLLDFRVPDLAVSPSAAVWCGRKQWTNFSLVRRSVSTRPSCNNHLHLMLKKIKVIYINYT